MQSLFAGKNFDRLTSEQEDLFETQHIEYFFYASKLFTSNS